jgi:cytochrome c oxidase assembly protein subunit 15
MRWSYNLERSRTVAIWLFAVAAIVLALVVVGGATRLTGSGLSITEWRPVTGAIPPLSEAGWAAEFARYQQIPQYSQLNAGMTLGGFKAIYWWEWSHRLLGRLVGVAFAVPFFVFLFLKMIPRRLIWRCVLLLGLGGLQGAVGWWMVSSGLSERVSVAPERLATHLGLALLVYGLCIWTGLEAWFGKARGGGMAGPRWRLGSRLLLGLAFFQTLLGALVAGNDAGLVYNDWPLMNGQVIPADYAAPAGGLWATLVHSQAAVQFNHRLFAYVLFLAAWAFALGAARTRFGGPVKPLAYAVALLVTAQAGLGIWTLMAVAPLSLSILHQLGAVAVLTACLGLAWRMRRE